MQPCAAPVERPLHAVTMAPMSARPRPNFLQRPGPGILHERPRARRSCRMARDAAPNLEELDDRMWAKLEPDLDQPGRHRLDRPVVCRLAPPHLTDLYAARGLQPPR